VLLNYYTRRSVLGSLCVGDLVRLGWSGVRVATRTPLQPSRTETSTHFEPRTIRPMW